MNILIKNANVVDSSQNFIGDVYIENGKIKELGTSINKNDVEVVDHTIKTVSVGSFCKLVQVRAFANQFSDDVKIFFRNPFAHRTVFDE